MITTDYNGSFAFCATAWWQKRQLMSSIEKIFVNLKSRLQLKFRAKSASFVKRVKR